MRTSLLLLAFGATLLAGGRDPKKRRQRVHHRLT
jgi:hypothetical protein